MSVKIRVGGTDYDVDETQQKVMEYIAESEQIKKIDEPVTIYHNLQIEIKAFDKATYEELIAIGNAVKWEFPNVPLVKTNELKDLIGNNLSELLGNKNYVQINSLYRAAHFLKIKGLRRCIAATIASKVFIKPTLADYEARKK